MSEHRLRSIGFLGLLLLAVPALAQKVNVDWDRDYQGPFETYAWVEPKDGAQNPLIHQRIVNALDYWMTMRGHRQVEPNENPDVVLTYHTNTREDVVVTADSWGYGYGPGFYWGGMGGTTTMRSHTYTKGTLVVDVWEPREKRLLFRGTATETIDENPEKLEKKINKCVEKMVKEFDKKLAKEEKKKAT